MRKQENPLLKDIEACDLIHKLIHWGYEKEQILDAYNELLDQDWERNDEDNFVG